ncbi:MAG: hypothetical protein ACK5AZ_12275 [Bryobacteraceae bacterium]
MREVIRIFRKDARLLRLEIAAVLAVLSVATFTKHTILGELAAQYLFVPLWAFLIYRTVSANSGPVAWTSLLSAKILFFGAFIHIPNSPDSFGAR